MWGWRMVQTQVQYLQSLHRVAILHSREIFLKTKHDFVRPSGCDRSTNMPFVGVVCGRVCYMPDDSTWVSDEAAEHDLWPASVSGDSGMCNKL